MVGKFTRGPNVSSAELSRSLQPPMTADRMGPSQVGRQTLSLSDVPICVRLNYTIGVRLSAGKLK